MINLIIFSALTLPSILAQSQNIQNIGPLENGSPPGTLILKCGVSQPVWLYEGDNFYIPGNGVNGNKDPSKFTISSSGSTVSNAQPLSGSYVGQYTCYDLTDPDNKYIFMVTIPGASNLSGGAIAGIVIGVLLALVLIAGLIFFGYQRGWFGESDQYDEAEGNDILNDGNMNETASTNRFKKPSAANGRSEFGSYA